MKQLVTSKHMPSNWRLGSLQEGVVYFELFHCTSIRIMHKVKSIWSRCSISSSEYCISFSILEYQVQIHSGSVFLRAQLFYFTLRPNEELFTCFIWKLHLSLSHWSGLSCNKNLASFFLCSQSPYWWMTSKFISVGKLRFIKYVQK